MTAQPVRRVLRAAPVASVNWREQFESRPLGDRDEHLRAYRDQLEHLVYLAPQEWEPGDEALWAAAPQRYQREAYARTQ